MAFDPLTQPVDYIKLAGQKSPGLADIVGAEALRAFVIRQPPFSTGALIVFKRRELAKFSVKIRLYTSEQHAEWATWRKIVDAMPGVRRRAQGLDIVHPLLNELDIKSVVVESVSQGEQTADGEWTYTIKFIEHRGLPTPSLAKVEGSQAAPLDPVEQNILNNQKRIEELAQQLAGPPPIPRAP